MHVESARVLVPAATGLALRNVLRTDLPLELGRRGLEPVFLVPGALAARLREEDLRAPGVVDVLPEARHHAGEVALRDLAFSVVQRRHALATIEIRRQLAARGRPRRPLKERVAPLLGSSWTLYHVVDGVRRTLYRAPEMQAVLDRCRPAAVFANNVFHPAEAALLRRAQRAHVPTVGMVHSWDNPSNKGQLPARPDRLLVWGDVMRAEMRDYFRFPDARIECVGTPQFDVYARPLATTRADLLAHYGFAPGTRLVLYATGSPGHCPWEPDYARRLLALVRSEHGRGPLGLVVRLHPRDRAERYAHLASAAELRLETAGRADDEMDDRFNPTADDHAHFAALIRHADVVVNLASTVALDAAANDRPIVHVRYDVEPGRAYLDSVERLFDYTHTARLLACGASEVARSPEELDAAVLRCLDDPARHHAARRALAAQEGFDGTGRSAERIADVVARVARRSAG